MFGHIVEPQRLGVPDQLAEHTVPAGKRTDDPACLLVDAEGQEALELALVLVEDAERRVAGPRQVAGGLEQLIQYRLEIELGNERIGPRPATAPSLRPSRLRSGPADRPRPVTRCPDLTGLNGRRGKIRSFVAALRRCSPPVAWRSWNRDDAPSPGRA